MLFDDMMKLNGKQTIYQMIQFAERVKERVQASGKWQGPIVTEIVPATDFWEAEGYHQDYYLKNPVRFRYYRWNCGRDARLEQVWGAAPTH